MRAAPVLSGAISGCEWLVPSGNTSTASPRASAATAASKVASLRPTSLGSSCGR
jgi:hypothetical protein